jgi:hypothetical protein
MNLPRAAFMIGDPATHTTSGQIGTIAGIRRHDETLQYLFDCPIFKQWLTIGKLERLEKAVVSEANFDEDGEVEYKLFDVALVTMREADLVTVTVCLTNDVSYELTFNYSREQERAKGLHGYLTTVGSVTESLLSAIGMVKV